MSPIRHPYLVFTFVSEEVLSTDSGVGFNLNSYGTESSEVDTEVDECGGSVKPDTALPLAAIIAILCFSGNSLVIFFYSRSKEIAESKIFELAFAVLDMVACFFLLPVISLARLSRCICSHVLVI